MSPPFPPIAPIHTGADRTASHVAAASPQRRPDADQNSVVASSTIRTNDHRRNTVFPRRRRCREGALAPAIPYEESALVAVVKWVHSPGVTAIAVTLQNPFLPFLLFLRPIHQFNAPNAPYLDTCESPVSPHGGAISLPPYLHKHNSLSIDDL